MQFKWHHARLVFKYWDLFCMGPCPRGGSNVAKKNGFLGITLITIAIVIIPIIIANLRPHQVFQVSDVRPSLRGSTPVCSHLQPQAALTLHLFIFITPVQCAVYTWISQYHTTASALLQSQFHTVLHSCTQCNRPVHLVQCNLSSAPHLGRQSRFMTLAERYWALTLAIETIHKQLN